MRGEQRAEGLTLLPGGPDGPGSPVGPGDPWLGERTQSIRSLSCQDTGLRKHLAIQSFLWLALHGPLSGEYSKSHALLVALRDSNSYPTAVVSGTNRSPGTCLSLTPWKSGFHHVITYISLAERPSQSPRQRVREQGHVTTRLAHSLCPQPFTSIAACLRSTTQVFALPWVSDPV